MQGNVPADENLLFSLAIVLHMSLDDLCELLSSCDLALDYTEVKDTVIAYLLSRNIFNSEMVKAALAEYRVGNLFLKDGKEEGEKEAPEA